MRARLLHRRLAMGMALAALLAFAGSAGVEPVPAALAGVAFVAALAWRPGPEWSHRLERLWIPLATLLVVRALFAVFFLGGDVVIPVVDLLLLLLAAEGFRSLDAGNGARIYALSFALLLASSAYRPGALFAVGFVLFVTFGTMALAVGHLLRQAERGGGGAARVRIGGRLLGTLAGLSAATLVLAVLVFVTFPRTGRGWSGRGEVLATSIAGFSTEVSLAEHGSRIHANPEVVLRVELDEGRPGDLASLLWRGRSYDRFDGVRWSRSRGLPSSFAAPAVYRNRWPDRTRTQRIYAAPLEERVLFALHPAVSLEIRGGVRPFFDAAGDLSYWGSGRPAYGVVSMGERPSPSQLRGSPDTPAPADRWYLQLPELSPRVHGLADSLTADEPTRYDRVSAVQAWLRSGFGYTRDLPASSREATLEHFLFERREGHCEYFSTAMAVLLRAAGIPARNVNGFLGGEWNEFGGYIAVTQNQAHSWVEVWFPRFGWVPFDPTPGGGGGSGEAAGGLFPGRLLFDGLSHRWGKWVLDFSPAEQTGILGGLRDLLGGDGAGGLDGPGLPDLPPLGWVLIVLAAGGAGALLVLRRGPGRPLESRLYLDLREACADAGFPVGPATPPGGLLERLVEAGHPAADPAREVVERYQAVRFGGLAPDPDGRAAMRASLRRAVARLRGRE